MKQKLYGLALLLALAVAACARQQTPPTAAQQAAPRQAAPAAPKTHLKVGDTAPDFTLPNTKGEPVKLSDFRGKKQVVLAFYVLAFTGG